MLTHAFFKLACAKKIIIITDSNVPLTHFMLFVFLKRTAMKNIEQNQQPIYDSGNLKTITMQFIFILVLFTMQRCKIREMVVLCCCHGVCFLCRSAPGITVA